MGPGFVRRDVPAQLGGVGGGEGRCFNGARLRSPGCALPLVVLQPHRPIASMGPGFVRRDVRVVGAALDTPQDASMGPGFVRRDVPWLFVPRHDVVGSFNGARLRSPGCAARARSGLQHVIFKDHRERGRTALTLASTPALARRATAAQSSVQQRTASEAGAFLIAAPLAQRAGSLPKSAAVGAASAGAPRRGALRGTSPARSSSLSDSARTGLSR